MLVHSKILRTLLVDYWSRIWVPWRFQWSMLGRCLSATSWHSSDWWSPSTGPRIDPSLPCPRETASKGRKSHYPCMSKIGRGKWAQLTAGHARMKCLREQVPAPAYTRRQHWQGWWRQYLANPGEAEIGQPCGATLPCPPVPGVASASSDCTGILPDILGALRWMLEWRSCGQGSVLRQGWHLGVHWSLLWMTGHSSQLFWQYCSCC